MKKLIRNTFSTLILLFCLHSIYAQPLREVTYKMMLETADNSFDIEDYYNAAEWYEKAYKEQKDKDIAIKVAQCNYYMRDYKRALSWYKRVISRDKSGFYANYKLEYGKVQKMMGEYSDAYQTLSEFIAETDDDERRKEAALIANGIAKSSEFEENVDAIIKPVHKNVNSPSSESGPIMFEDKLYYSSLNRKDEIVYDGNTEGQTMFKIFTSQINDKGVYDKGSELSEEINREGYHTGNPSFSDDGLVMYFNRMLVEDGDILESKIFYSKKNGENWGASNEVEGDIGNHIIKHAVVGELYGKDVMFFTADLEGGFGGFDIYYSEANGPYSFGTPINLGETINTPYDEVTPFYREGVMYFSSDGYPSLGGKDIFKTTWDGSNWSEVTNMGTGYNSAADDMYYSMDKEGLQGFLVSNRVVEKKRSVKSKTCCDDIFSVTFREVIIDLLAKITDTEDEPLKEAELTLVDMSVGEDKNAPERKVNLNSNDFNFALDEDKKYKVIVKIKGFYPDSITFNTVGILDDYTVERTIALKEIPDPPPPKEETVTVVTNQPIRMNNIYYTLNSDKILPSAEGDLAYIQDIMLKYPSMVIELSSHTDSQGLTRNNQDLSQRRSNSAKRWLTDRGIASERIQAVGYGEEFILNRCVNGVRCSDEEHQFNRRTEFKILSGPTTIEIKKQKSAAPSGGLPMNFDVDLYSEVDTNDNLPKLEFSANEFQLGEVKVGDAVDMEFEYINTGKADLIIEVVTACHCTTFEYDKTPLKPGESAKISVSYDAGAKGKTGEFREVVNIICNTDNVVEEAIFHVTVID